MAEFKLGRIRFVWKNDWASGTQYFVDDVVRYGGRTYICVVGHTASDDFYTDLNFVPTRWNQMTDGQSWQGDWSTSTFYRERDIVKYGGLLYIATTSHTSVDNTTDGLENDIGNWELFAEGFDWKGDWNTNTRYKLNDIVAYGGITYVCNTGHTSAATSTLGLENDQGNWDEYNEGIEYKGAWSGSSVRYKKNDVVKYGAGLYIAVTAHTSTATFTDDESNWAEFVKGFEFENSWTDSTIYQPGDVVRYGGNQYISLTHHVNTNPTSVGNSDWQLFLEGFSWQGERVLATDYKIGEVVSVNGYNYVAVADSTSATGTITQTNSATNYFTTSDTSGLEAGQTIQFSGSSLGDVNLGANYYVKTVVNSTNFTITDTSGGTVITPINATGSMTFTANSDIADTNYWSLLSEGIKWQGEWQDDQEYFVGDAVIYDVNTYICVKNHRSEGDDGSTIREEGGGLANSRPDQDATGTYWNLLTVGTETGVLTTTGDLVYYGGAGPVRLPIGAEGQVLAAGEQYPEWQSINDTPGVLYVAPNGVDLPSPIHGKTLNKPFKTVRYAAEQAEHGPRVPNTAYLLEMNRVFIQRETIEYVIYEIANDVTPFTSAYEFNDYLWETKIGVLIDAFINDLKRGGNEKTRAAAIDFVNNAFYETGDEAKINAAINYAIGLIEDVLNQTAPDTNYQTLNGDNSTSIVEQFFDATITAETDYETDSGGTGYLGGYTGVSGSSGSQAPTYGGGY